MKPSLPVAGVWQRLWEEDPLGDTENADRDTLVLWTQSSASGIYVDLRLPKDSPGRSLEAAKAAKYSPRPAALAARGYNNNNNNNMISPEQLDILAKQKSFAGHLEYSVGDTTSSGDALKKDTILAELANKAATSNGAAGGALPLCTCFWKRDIDYQPPSGGLDVGVCASEPVNSDGSIDLRETGDDASYAEGWHRLPGTVDGPFMALQLVSENNNDRVGYWVRAGNRFAYAIGRPINAEAATVMNCHKQSWEVQTKVGKSLAEVMQEDIEGGSVTDKLNVMGSYVVVFGEINDDNNNKQWRILHSTNAELIGCLLVGNNEKDELCCSILNSDNNSCVKEGDSIDQVLLLDGDGNNEKLVRKWKVVELSGCSLP